jgi:hypothetical protein
MSSIVVSRRIALFGLGAFASAGLAGCNTTQAPVPSAVGGPTLAAAAGYRIASIAVDTTPLVAQSGNPTAEWAQESLPGALAQAFARHMAPGDPSGGALSVVVNSIYLGGGGPADPDRMRGVATFNGQQWSVLATSTYFPNPTDQALVEEALQDRVNSLSVAFAFWLKRRVRR